MKGSLVECHSGSAYAERPRAFEWEGERLEIKVVVSEWQTPEGKHFLVSTKQTQTFELVYDFVSEMWKVIRQEKIKS